DPGAVGPRGTYEKNVTLAIAKRLVGVLNAQPDMRAILTRDDDYFVPLNVRVQKARRVQADLFISIHADAFTTPTARGSSVFAVLKAPDIPSILVETAFISNPDEELKLKSDKYQQKFAGSIFSGVKRYFAQNPPLSRSKLS